MIADENNCDFSPVKKQIIHDMELLSHEIMQNIISMDAENTCILASLQALKERFYTIETKAASFYLMCYLSPYTSKYIEISNSIKNLSARRHGALIVVQRNDDVGLLIQKGTPVGAILSSLLLENIFYPGSPLHDGAVVIQGKTIVSAANVLPIVSKPPTDMTLGTRHRAALGMSEQSDALVIVVSEETGRASFAVDGKLYPISSDMNPIVQ